MFGPRTTINGLLLFALIEIVGCTQVPAIPYYPPPEGSLSRHGGWFSDAPVVGINASGNPTILWAESWGRCNYGGWAPVCNSQRELNTKTWNDENSTWDYRQIGTNKSVPSAPYYYLGRNGVPYAVFGDTSNRLNRWDGEQWIPVYGELGFDFPVGYFLLDSHDYPVVVGVKSTGSPNLVGELVVYYWDGTNWAQLGQAVERSQEKNRIGDLSIALDSENYPTVAFVSVHSSAVVPEDNFSVLRVKRWSGTEWVALGDEIAKADFLSELYVRLDAQGNPVVAFFSRNQEEYINQLRVKRWDGQNWVELGSLPRAFHASVSMELDSKGNPVMACLESTTGLLDNLAETIVLLRWDGNSWVLMETIRKPAAARGLGSPRLAIWAKGVFVVYLQSYVEQDPNPPHGDYIFRYIYAEMRGL